MISYICLLRGINVGGNKKVEMSRLKSLFESLNFTNVKTLLNTGNVIFDSNEKNISNLITTIEKSLQKTFGFEIATILRTQTQIENIIKQNPFQKIKVTPQTRLYITFLTEKPLHTIPIPYHSPTQDFTILKATDTEIISYLEISPTTRSVDSMKILEKEFGKLITTRNWNTIVKLTTKN